MGKGILQILVFLALNAASNISTGQTVIPAGEASGTWSMENAPYVIKGNVIVPPDSTLRIGPGVRVEFDGYYGIEIRGTLVAAGNQVDSVCFTVSDTTGFEDLDTARGGWNGIVFENVDPSQDSSILKYCIFEYGKAIGDSWPFNSGGALRVMGFGKVRLERCTFVHNIAGGENGSSGGAVYLGWAPIRMDGNVFALNQARDGGAVHLYDSDVAFSGNRIEGNAATNGGGIFIAESSPSFSGDSITGNTALIAGGGIQACSSADQEAILLDRVYFSRNSSNWGGACGFAGMHLELQSIYFDQNFASWLGGALAADYCTLQVSNTAFLLDSTFDSGGALHLDHVKGSFVNSAFSQNSAFNGGAVNAFFSDLVFDSCVFSENKADWNGGALHILNSNLRVKAGNLNNNLSMQNGGAVYYLIDSLETSQPYRFILQNSMLTDNSGIFSGGAMYVSQTQEDRIGQMDIGQCRFIGNYSERNSGFLVFGFNDLVFSDNVVSLNESGIRTSGAIFNSSSGWVVNSIFDGNSAPSGTAGCGLITGSEMHFMHCLFTGNSSPLAGGLHVRNGSVATLTNCILWENHPTQLMLSTNADTLPCAAYLNYSVIQNGLDSVLADASCEVVWGSGMQTVNPVFVNVFDHDFHLMDQSICIGSGIPAIEVEGWHLTCPAHDIEANPRPAPAGTRPDIGPYESPLGLPVSSGEARNEECRVSIAPNPASREVLVTLDAERSFYVGITLLDMRGVLVRGLGEVLCEPGTMVRKVQIGELPAGIYFLVITAGEKWIRIFPLQVQ